MSILSIFMKIDKLLDIGQTKNLVIRVRMRLLGILIMAAIPVALANAAMSYAMRGEWLLLCLATAPVALALLYSLKRGAGHKRLALIFGLFMQAVFFEGLFKQHSPVTLGWIAAAPFFMTLSANAAVGAAVLAAPLFLVLAGMHRYLIAPFEPPFDFLTDLAELFSSSPGTDLFSYALLICVLYGTGVFFNRLSMELYQDVLSGRTKLRNTIARLRRKEAELEGEIDFRNALFEIIPVPVFVTDRDFKYRSCTESFYELIGRRRGDILGRDVEELYEPDLTRTFATADRRLAEERPDQCYTACITRPDGSRRDLILYRRMIADREGSFAGIIGVALDETERLGRERALRELLDVRRDALALVSHDLRGPIGAFRDLLDAADTENRLDAGELRTITMELKARLSSLWTLMNELVEWAAMDQGLADYNAERLDLGPLMAELDALYAPEADKKGIRFSAEAELGTEICGDRRMIAAVLRNLTANAVKFTIAGGSVSVRGYPRAEEGGTELLVADTGVGIEEQHLRHFMESGKLRYRRGTRGEAGSGLGLSLVRGLMERHGGTIRIESSPGKGTSVYVFFPDAQAL